MYGNSGYNPKGIRLGGNSRNKSAVKIWDKREFKNLDDQVSMNTRNIKVALRRLRKFARLGSELEFDLVDQWMNMLKFLKKFSQLQIQNLKA